MGENPDLPAVASDNSVVARIKSEIDISDPARLVTFGDRAQRAVGGLCRPHPLIACAAQTDS
jgi:hypothetical protein